jgi:hypothetical protein
MRAEPQGDGSCSPFGTKIFITGGELDMTGNIVIWCWLGRRDRPRG